MKKVAFIFLAVLLAAPAVAEEVNQTRDADPNGKVSVSNTSGEIEIVGWNRNQVQVTGTLGDDVEELIFETSGRQTTIKVKIPSHRGHFDDASAELVIRVPRGSSIDVGVVSADIDVEGVRGEQELHSVSGDITTEVYGADVEAESVSGDIEAEGKGEDARAELASVSGDVTAKDLKGEISAGTVSGDIDIDGGSFGRAGLETVNGDIEFAAELRKSGKMNVETVNGTVDIQFDGAVDARFDIETFNGRIKNCFGPKAERTSKYAPGWELTFVEGSGEGRVVISTLNGSVTLCK